MEIWKDISEIEGMEEYTDYQISSYGRVKSLKRGRETILKPRATRNDYLRVQLSVNGIAKDFYIHRLVAFAFIQNDNPIEKTDINHIDENKANNKIDNLEWCTKEYNNKYGTKIERISKKVYCVELDRIFSSTQEVKRLLGLNQGNVSACCRGELKTSGGYHWQYI